jgi:hypothetical protein
VRIIVQRPVSAFLIHQFELVDVEDPEIGDLQVRIDRQRQEGDVHIPKAGANQAH